MGESSNVLYPGPSGNEDRWQTRFAGIPTGFVVPQPPIYPQNPTGTSTAGQIRDAYGEVKFDDQAFFVMRIDHVAGDMNGSTATTNPGQNGGNDNVYIWLNPNLNTTPLEANASIKYVSTDIVNTANTLATPIQPYSGAPGTTGAGNGGEIDFNRIRLFARQPNGTSPIAQWLFDELRVGESFADVAPFTAGGVPGDYSQNNVVDAADYIVSRSANARVRPRWITEVGVSPELSATPITISGGHVSGPPLAPAAWRPFPNRPPGCSSQSHAVHGRPLVDVDVRDECSDDFAEPRSFAIVVGKRTRLFL